MDTLSEALRYGEAGLHVIPIRARSKRPAIRTGPAHTDAATVDPLVIYDWFADRPDWNVAIVCTPSKLVVIDIDGPEGEVSLTKLTDMYGDPPATWEAETANGRHLLYRWPTNHPIPTFSADTKLDIRGAGSYIVAPPSTHPTGHIYRWTATGGPIPDAPRWLTDRRGSTAVTSLARSGSRDRTFTAMVTTEMLESVLARF